MFHCSARSGTIEKGCVEPQWLRHRNDVGITSHLSGSWRLLHSFPSGLGMDISKSSCSLVFASLLTSCRPWTRKDFTLTGWDNQLLCNWRRNCSWLPSEWLSRRTSIAGRFPAAFQVLFTFIAQFRFNCIMTRSHCFHGRSLIPQPRGTMPFGRARVCPRLHSEGEVRDFQREGQRCHFVLQAVFPAAPHTARLIADCLILTARRQAKARLGMS